MRAGESEGRFVKSEERMPRVCVVSSGAETCVAFFGLFRGCTTSEGELTNTIKADLSHKGVE